MNPYRLISLLALCLLLPACSSTKSVAELKHIQDTEGVFSKSLFYCGSSESWHFFEQDQFFEAFLPFPFRGDGVHKFKVERDSLSLPPRMEYRRSEYDGQDDSQRRKIRIQAPDARTGRAAVKPRQVARKPIDFSEIDWSKFEFEDERGGVWRITFDD